MSSRLSLANILLVEDDPLLAATARRHLERIAGSGCVSTAASLREAEQAWHQLQPSVAVVDYRLPDGFGTDLIRNMRAAGSAAQVICMTAESEAIPTSNQQELGIVSILTKPVSPDDLKTVLTQQTVTTGTKQTAARRIGRFRLIKCRPSMQGHFIPRLMRAAEHEKWIALELSSHHFRDSGITRGICAWAGWQSSRGGQLCILARDPQDARLARETTHGLVDIVATPSALANKPSHLTSQSERAQLINILHPSPPQEPAS